MNKMNAILTHVPIKMAKEKYARKNVKIHDHDAFADQLLMK